MPVDHKQKSVIFSQREVYKKGGIGRWYWDFRDKMIFSFIGKKHKNILDIGCGEGITLEKLINKYKDSKIINGVDILKENVKICQNLGLPVSEDSIYNLHTENNSIDACILSEVIEHLENIDMALKNINRILRSNGIIIIVFPHDIILKLARIIFFKFKEAFADVGHLHKFTPKTLVKLLESNGFAVISSKNIPFGLWTISLHGIIIAKKT